MSLFDLSQKTISDIETKGNWSWSDISFAEFLFSGGNGDLGAAEAIRLYYKCKPFFHAVKKRSAGFASIRPRVWDMDKEEFVIDHPIIKKLRNPNPFQGYDAFAMETAESFDVTGNAFTLAIGSVNRPPIDLFSEKASFVNLDSDRNSLYYPSEVTVSTKDNTRIYSLDEVTQNGIRTARYYNSNKDQEIWQIRDTSLYSNTAGLWGISRAQPLWFEIQQFVEANTNNLSILQRGGRPSLGWTWEGSSPMTDDQYMRAKQELQKYTGATNAGRQAILDKLKPAVIGQSLKDMEFSVNRETMQKYIYTTYNIPLAMISDKAMTLDNLKTSEFLLWRDSVLPLASFIFSEWSKFLLPRFDGVMNSENLKITFNPFDVEVLRRQRILDVLEMQRSLVFTDNELRQEMGWEALGEGGDSVWKPSNLLPAESDLYTEDNLTRPKSLTYDDSFIDSLKSMRMSNGEKLFTDAEIDHYMKGE